MDILKTFFIGIAVGIANVIPGVSGGTFAVVFNIYDKFVEAITLNVKKLWANRRFVLPLILGMGAGLLLFSKIITFLYTNYMAQTQYAFTGLIVGSIPLLWRLTFKKNDEQKIDRKKLITIIICIIAGFCLLLAFSILETKFSKDAAVEAVSKIDFKLTVLLFFAGVCGAVAMIVPGISGSLVLLMMGVYTIIIGAVSGLMGSSTFINSVLILIPAGCGIIAGLLGGAKFISWLFKKVPSQTYAVILGLIVCSVWTVCPGFKIIKTAGQGISCVLCFALGFTLAFWTSLERKKNTTEETMDESSEEEE